MADGQQRVEALLDAIDNYRSLAPDKKASLRPLFDETLDRFNMLSGCSKTINSFLDSVDLQGSLGTQ